MMETLTMLQSLERIRAHLNPNPWRARATDSCEYGRSADYSRWAALPTQRVSRSEVPRITLTITEEQP